MHRALFEEMTRLQQEYVQRVEEKIGSLEVMDDKVRIPGAGSDVPAVLPTTEELAAYVYESETYNQIELVQQDALQRAEEKVAIAEQTYSLVDNICKRLDSDLADMEKHLQVIISLKMILEQSELNLAKRFTNLTRFPFYCLGCVNIVGRRVSSTGNRQT
jgi:hypothetical protein